MKRTLATLAFVALVTPAFAAGNGHSGGKDRGNRGGHSQIFRGSFERGAWNGSYRGTEHSADYSSRSTDHSYNARNSYPSYSRRRNGNYGDPSSGYYPQLGYRYPANGALQCNYPGGYGGSYNYNSYPGINAGRCGSYRSGYGAQYRYRY